MDRRLLSALPVTGFGADDRIQTKPVRDRRQLVEHGRACMMGAMV
jgi:hypothetical protein